VHDFIHFDGDTGLDGGETLRRAPRMSTHAPELTQFLRERGIRYVRAEYSGTDDQGEFVLLELMREDGAYCHVSEPLRLLQIKTVFRALLLARHPDWYRGHGSCGDFRWNLTDDSLTHSHFVRGNSNDRMTYHGI